MVLSILNCREAWHISTGFLPGICIYNNIVILVLNLGSHFTPLFNIGIGVVWLEYRCGFTSNAFYKRIGKNHSILTQYWYLVYFLTINI